jgi:hypothetical protein
MVGEAVVLLKLLFVMESLTYFRYDASNETSNSALSWLAASPSSSGAQETDQAAPATDRHG